ncbi:olfactomedin-4-like isoform X2 [Leucoraja erinacea]|uniref:olfactomedin-4-like isoform X2 n=1 Tax=Leucoraja erinaceus TaxID=7782 RepID=UPI0024540BC4|nr:olfactomedin-4-like isoform X2 [Leucoraja erinacea]
MALFTLAGIFVILLRTAATVDGDVRGVSRVGKRCYCDLQMSDGVFPRQQFEELHSLSANCSQELNAKELKDPIDIFADMEQRLQKLVQRIDTLEEEYDGDLYSIISFRIIEIEYAELMDLLNQLQTINWRNQEKVDNLFVKVQNITDKVDELEEYDRLKVVKEHRKSMILKRSLSSCQSALLATPAPYITLLPGSCSFGKLVGVSDPKSSMLNHFGVSYRYGSWGMDPWPAPGKADQYWLTILSTSNRYGNKIRVFSSYGKFLTRSGAVDLTFITYNAQGSGGIMYKDAYYYNCYNLDQLCKFDMTTKTVLYAKLPYVGFNDKFPYCTVSSCYGYSDMDLATDENGLWVLYATEQNFGNLVVSQLNATDLSILKSWNTTLYKRSATNAFMVCGIVYATRYLNSEVEEIFYMFDTTTGVERNDLAIQIRKVSSGIQYMNYNPRDKTLYVYSDAYVVSYSLLFA